MSENAARDLLRRVPPNKIEARLYDVIHLCPDLTDMLLSTVDVPLKVVTDPETKEAFVACEFNRDLDSHRSPSSNKYYPPLPDGQQISPRLRKMEIKANKAFNAYRHLYYSSEGTSSVYLWDIEPQIFGCGVFVKHAVKTALRTGDLLEGTIDCSDVIEVEEGRGSAKYTLTSSVLLSVQVNIGLSGPLTVSGNTTERQVATKGFKSDDDHVVNIGILIEDNAARFRDIITSIYVSKMKQILDLMASQTTNATQKRMVDELAERLDQRHKA
jgi:capping protein beta